MGGRLIFTAAERAEPDLDALVIRDPILAKRTPVLSLHGASSLDGGSWNTTR